MKFVGLEELRVLRGRTPAICLITAAAPGKPKGACPPDEGIRHRAKRPPGPLNQVDGELPAPRHRPAGVAGFAKECVHPWTSKKSFTVMGRGNARHRPGAGQSAAAVDSHSRSEVV